MAFVGILHRTQIARNAIADELPNDYRTGYLATRHSDLFYLFVTDYR